MLSNTPYSVTIHSHALTDGSKVFDVALWEEYSNGRKIRVEFQAASKKDAEELSAGLVDLLNKHIAPDVAEQN